MKKEWFFYFYSCHFKKNCMKIRLHLLILFCLCLVDFIAISQIRILSGSKKEIYYQFAEDIKNNTNIPLENYSSQGSIDNLNRLMTDSFQIAFTQYDVLLFKEIENSDIKKNIKLFLPLYDEEIHLITRNNSAINTLKDLAGKRIGVGSKNSGTNITSQLIKLKTQIQWKDVSIPIENSFYALLHDSIDGFFIVGAAPVNILNSLSKNVQSIIKLVPITDKELDKIYKQKTIDAGTYPWQKNKISTYSTKSLLVLNTNNINESMSLQIDKLYDDLKDNLKGIQKNKFSHIKWKQVDFSNLKNIEWPVYKQEYVTAEKIFDLLAYIALILTGFQIYFVLNKLLKRKHEQTVAESISVSAMFISILINCFFASKNLLNNGMPQFSANILWVVCSGISAFVGIGFWVAGNQKQGIFRLLKRSLKLEKHEVGDLAKSFFRPSGADEIIEILGRIAMIDNELADEEQTFIQTFSDEWNIEIDWDFVKCNFTNIEGDGFIKLRQSMKTYLSSLPPQAQVSQLADVIVTLINADNKVTEEEELIQSELLGQINKYLGKLDTDLFISVVVPQFINQEGSYKEILSDLKKVFFAGGNVYLSEPYYSYKYAEVICEKYRKAGFLAIVTHYNNQ